jgi:hypothetical protein
MDKVIKLFETGARADRAGIIVTHIGLAVVLVWIGQPEGLPLLGRRHRAVRRQQPVHELLLPATRRRGSAAYELVLSGSSTAVYTRIAHRLAAMSIDTNPTRKRGYCFRGILACASG